MISTRQMYNADLEFFRRNDRGTHMPLSQNPHISDHYDTTGHLSRRTTPSSEADNRTPGGARKRVPVACQRCRKRKIKCSGNEDNNQSCANCINAGHAETCHFLRVQSEDYYSLVGKMHTPPRYSPYSLPPNHRLNYVTLSSRYNPQSSLQYPTVPSNMDYGPYAHPAPGVDWTRAPYVGSYSPYPDDEDTSPYSSHPPPYILPNTDPMTTANGYYVHAQNVRPHPGTLWPEPQQCMSQQTSHLPSSAYSVTTETPQPLYNGGLSGTLPSDRILPTPVSARSMAVPQTNSTDTLPVSSPTQRNSTYWSSAHHIPGQVDMATDSQQSHDNRRNTSYGMQDMASYNHIGMGEVLPSTSLLSALPLSASHDQTLTSRTATDDSQHQHQHQHSKARAVVSHDQSPTSTQESTSIAYSYTGSLSGRGTQQQQRSASSSHFSDGALYGRTQPLVARRDTAADDCSPDCSGGCPTDSARASVTSISNTSSSY
ncbi:hypothetical protein EDD37DRAFT_140042 [Exophiala viscosa]|uniref:uncharacterized protein n=1 Tax=Exophiala viscosa TaxID=2486360 RepID=UPI00219C754E|nr:hypothetical protein EDD37DRAFT_140042 [Exophiala viscosa]